MARSALLRRCLYSRLVHIHHARLPLLLYCRTEDLERVNLAALYALAGTKAPFTPALVALPNDFTVALYFTVPNESGAAVSLGGTHPIAIDADGSVWVVGMDPIDAKNVFKLSSSGAFLSPPGGYTGGGLNEPRSIAIDPSGNAWINGFTTGAQPTTSIAKLSSTGVALSPATGFVPGPMLGRDIAIDGSGNAWLSSGIGVVEVSSSGSLVSAIPNPPADPQEQVEGLALDGNGNVWGVVFQFDFVVGGNPVAEFSNTGAPIVPPGVGQFSCGAGPISDEGPQDMALDAAGNFWFTGGQGVTKESNSPIPPCSGTGGGIVGFVEDGGGPIAIDGDGNVWVVNEVGSIVLSELDNNGAPISPSIGYHTPGMAVSALALDGSGNLWATGEAGMDQAYTVFEYVGAAAPVVTPLSAGVRNHTIATRP